jgi:phosphonopyruvate decarboxylase
MMRKEQVLEALARHRREAVVVSTMTVLPLWKQTSPSPRNMSCVGFMGGASGLGLGIALGRPDEKVWVLDGDGSLLMQLGSLATIAGAAPPNFYHFLFDNGVYETSGAQPVPNSGRLDWALMARGAGYTAAYSFESIEDLETELESILSQTGPVFVAVRVYPEPDDSRPLPAAGVDVAAEARVLQATLAGGQA